MATYTIKSGDTLSGIAAKNKTTVSDLMKANPNITDANKISAGSSINLTSPSLSGYQPLSSLPALAASRGITSSDTSTTTPSMGVQAKSPSLTVTTTPSILPAKSVYTPPVTTANTTTTTPVVGTHVGNISNNPAYGPVGSIITREGLQKIASGQDSNNPSPQESYVKAYTGALGTTAYPVIEAANKAYEKTVSQQPITNTTSTNNLTNPLKTNVASAETVPTTNTNVPVNNTTVSQNTTNTATSIPTSQNVTSATTTTPEISKEIILPEDRAKLLQNLTDLKNNFDTAYKDQYEKINQLSQQFQNQLGGIAQTSGDASLQMGKGGLLQQLAAQKIAVEQQKLQDIKSGYESQVNIINSQLGITAPTTQAATGLLTNPFTGNAITGNLGSAITVGTNIKTIQEGTAKINSIDQQAPAAKNNLQLAINIAKQSGLNPSIPIINQVKQIFGVNFETNPSYQAFQTQLGSIKAAYANMGIDPGISDWSTITVDQLNYLSQTLDKNVANTRQAIQDNINSLTSNISGNTISNQSVGQYDW